MTILVIGRNGQVATALREKVEGAGIELITLARPDLDLSGTPDRIGDLVAKIGSDASLIVNAAAYTAVDKAETEIDLAMAINGAAAGAVASAASYLGIPIVHLSTDYVFDGEKDGPWLETDEANPLGVYGHSKLLGEEAIRATTSTHVILRTAWVYSPFGQNFVKTMLRLAGEHDQLGVVEDQQGSPTSALDIADAILDIAVKLQAAPDDQTLYGTFHLAGTGTTSWADFARAIFAGAGDRGHPTADVVAITTSDYPTRAVRPKNSVLATDRLFERYGIRLPAWEASLDTVLDRLIQTARKA